MSSSNPKNDPRTVDQLVNAALTESDETIAWHAVCALHWRGTRDVLQRAEVLSVSSCAEERKLGADILGQLGVPGRTFPDESSKRLRAMLQATEQADVLRAALVGLSHHNDELAIPLACEFSTHADPEVRHAAVLALTGYETPLAIECLVALCEDANAQVRDWAAFALGTQIEMDSPLIRDALAKRLDDKDEDARGEALIGLAHRRDPRVIDALKKELSSESVGTLAIEAAALVASTELHSHLIELRSWWDIDPDLLQQAIKASEAS